MANVTKAYVEATSLSVRFLIAEKKCMAKELQAAKQGGEWVTSSAKAELKRAILDEVSSLEVVMQMLYSKFVTMHKLVLHLKYRQQHCARRECSLSNIHTIVDHMQTCTMRYKGSQLSLPKIMKPKAVELKACI